MTQRSMRRYCPTHIRRMKLRGHPRYVLVQKRFPLDRTVSMQAAKRCTELVRIGCGGGWDGKNGDGEAWIALAYTRVLDLSKSRAIKSGRWHGPWKRS